MLTGKPLHKTPAPDFTALFSQFIPEGPGAVTILGMASVAGLVDGTWYSLISLLVGRIGLDKKLYRHRIMLNRASAVFYLVIAGLSLVNMTALPA